MEQNFLIYNTLTRQKELFRPLTPGRVGMYASTLEPPTAMPHR